MAKSMRSKIKRRFRAIKRQSVFAPVEAARAQRLAAKQTEQQTSPSGEQQKVESATDLTGSLCYEILGLIDPEIIDSTNIEGLMSVLSGVLSDSF